MSNPQEYTVGWICAIGTEYTAAQACFDEKHDAPECVSPNDHNNYTLGKMGKHNVVIAALPDGEYGTACAASIARDMLHSFPNVKIGLMVGVGGGAPSQDHDIRLGDVVVSIPRNGNGGVFQYDFGKTIQDQTFRATGFLDQPPTILRTAVTTLRSHYEFYGHKLREDIDSVLEKYPRLRQKYQRPDPSTDRLFRPEVTHDSSCGADCSLYQTNLMPRHSRTDDKDDPAIHYGLIASGNQLMKDAILRDKLAAEKEVLCFEMEAAGLMNHFPCLVIRGICDYSDSHKNKGWQGYAAMVAAAYAKDLLRLILPSRIEAEKRINEVLSNISGAISATEANVRQMKSQLREDEHTKILNWLTPANYGSQQSDYLGRHQQGTGQWLLNSEKYQSWLNSSQQVLFCPGIPGAGKTILTSVVIDDLATRFQGEDDVGIAYVYCNFQRTQEQNIHHLLASLLKQLAQSQPSLPEPLQALYERHKKDETRPSLDETSVALQLVAGSYSRVFLLVDALDECQALCRTRLLPELFKLQREQGANVFATSRFIQNIVDQFNDVLVEEIRATNGDVRTYLEGQMGHMPSMVKTRPHLQEEINTGVSGAVDGMFLLAHLYLASLRDKTSPKQIRGALDDLKRQNHGSSEDEKLKVLARTYEQAMDRINAQEPGFRKLALRVLSWIVCAKRQLTTAELQHAFGVEPGEKHLDPENFSDIEDMVSVCAGLVTVDRERNVIRLAHYTTQEYLHVTQARWFPDVERDITSTCVTYNSFNDFQSGFCGTEQGFQERLQSHPFYDYSARHWGYHARAAWPQVSSLSRDFLCDEATVSASWQVVRSSDGFYSSLNMSKSRTGMHLAAYFGLDRAIHELVEMGVDPDANDADARTPLSVAAEHGHLAAVRMLLAQDTVYHDHTDRKKRTPLSIASENGHERVAELLLSAGAAADHRCSDSRTALSYAAENGAESVVKLLLEAGAEVNSASRDGRAPLLYAAKAGNTAIATQLLERGANPNYYRQTDMDRSYVRNRDGPQTPLAHAASKGNEGLIKLLLDSGADPDCRISILRTPLSYAAENGNVNIIKLLLERGAEIDSVACEDQTEGARGRTPLSYAAQRGHHEAVRLLLAEGAHFDSRVRFAGIDPYAQEKLHKSFTERFFGSLEMEDRCDVGRTPLSYAADGGDREIVGLLLESGAEPDLRDRDGRTPLSYAASAGHTAVVQVLLERGAEPDSNKRSQHGKGRTPLSYAAEKGQLSTVRLLLDSLAELESRDDYKGRSSLCYAASRGHTEVVRLLMEKGAQLDSGDDTGRTPLSYAAQDGRGNVIRLLLENGARADSQDTSGRTPLLWAASRGHGAVVDLLIEKGAQPDAEDDTGRTPLSLAAEKGHISVIQLLLERGARLDSRDKHERTPVSWGLDPGSWMNSHTYSSIVQLLLARVEKSGVAEGEARRLLSYAAGNGHVETTKMLLDLGFGTESTTAEDDPPLVRAAQSGHKIIAELFLSRGFNPNSTDRYSRPPLSLAAEKGLISIVRLLLEYGAHPDTEDGRGRTPLSYAAAGRYRSIVELLLSKGSNPDSPDGQKRTPLSHAAESGSDSVIRLLIDNGARPDVEDDNGRTPLSYAAAGGHRSVVDRLLRLLSRPDMADTHRRTPLSYAAAIGSRSVVRLLLLNSNVDPDSEDDSKRTPLSYAAEAGHISIVEPLVDRGARLDCRDRKGWTPILYASTEGHNAVAALLLDKAANMSSIRGLENALCRAVGAGHDTMVRLVLGHGADPSLNVTITTEPRNTGQYTLYEARNTRAEYVSILKNMSGKTSLSARSDSNLAALLLQHPSKDEQRKNDQSMWIWIFAVQAGHLSIAKQLVESTAKLRWEDSSGQMPLCIATGGHEELLRLMLQKGFEPNSRDVEGRTLLSYAAESGNAAVIRLLLDQGARLDLEDNNGRRPLTYAAMSGAEAAVELLLDHGAEPNTTDNSTQLTLDQVIKQDPQVLENLLLETSEVIASVAAGKQENRRTPLSYAVEKGHRRVVEMLLDRGADIEFGDDHGRRPLSVAAENGNHSAVAVLLERGAIADRKDGDGRTPLSYAAAQGSTVIARLIMEHDVESDSKDNKQRTPLSYAAERGHKGVMLLLLGRKTVEVDSIDGNGRSALSYAAAYGDRTVVELLLEKGAGSDLGDSRRRTPLSYAAEKGHGAVIRTLLRAGAARDLADESGQTPLSYAANSGCWAVIQLLLESGANPSTTDENGRSLLSHEARLGHYAVANMLLASGVEVDSTDSRGRTPLSHAAEGGHGKVVDLLLRAGANANLKDNDGRIPLSWAAIQRHGIWAQERNDFWPRMACKLLVEKTIDLESEDHEGATPLTYAVMADFRWLVDLLLEREASPDHKDHRGRTPLSRAVEGTMIEPLLKRSADVDPKDNEGRTPLSYAVERGWLGTIQWLLDCGADMHSKDNSGRTLLSWAASRPRYLESGSVGTSGEDEHVVQLLLDGGVECDSKDDGGRTPLSYAAQRGEQDSHETTAVIFSKMIMRQSVVERLLAHGAQANSADRHGRTPLFYAAGGGHKVVTRLLLDGGADPTVPDEQGALPLHIACQFGHDEVASLLLRDGAAGINARAHNGAAPLHAASQSGNARAVRLLLGSGADISPENRDGGTPLLMASAMGHSEVVKLLLEAGADASAAVATTAQRAGISPLFAASAGGHAKVIQLLLQSGADARNVSKDHPSPLLLASEKGLVDAVRSLLERGADANAAWNGGAAPLHLAAQNGHPEVVKLLLSHGADVKAALENGFTPLHLASANGRFETAKLLLKHGADGLLPNAAGIAPIHLAVARKHLHVAAWIITQAAVAEAMPQIAAAGNEQPINSEALNRRRKEMEKICMSAFQKYL